MDDRIQSNIFKSLSEVYVSIGLCLYYSIPIEPGVTAHNQPSVWYGLWALLLLVVSEWSRMWFLPHWVQSATPFHKKPLISPSLTNAAVHHGTSYDPAPDIHHEGMKLDNNTVPVQQSIPNNNQCDKTVNKTSTGRNQSTSRRRYQVVMWPADATVENYRWTCNIWCWSLFTYIGGTLEMNGRYEQEDRRQPEKSDSTWPPGV